MCGLRTVPADNAGASYCRLQLVFTPLFTPPSGPPWKAHRGTFGLSRHPNELLVSNRCSCRYRHQYTRSAPTRFGHSRNFFFHRPLTSSPSDRLGASWGGCAPWRHSARPERFVTNPGCQDRYVRRTTRSTRERYAAVRSQRRPNIPAPASHHMAHQTPAATV